MSRRRYLSTEISIDTAVNRLARTAGDFAVMLYTWMIPHCDDEGIVHGDAEEIILQVIPGRRDKKIEDVTSALAAMQEHGLIEWDQEGRCVRFPIGSFYKYQTYIKEDRRRGAQPNNAPEAPQDADNSANQRKTPQDTASHSHSPPVNPSPSHSEEKPPTPLRGGGERGIPLPSPFLVAERDYEWASAGGLTDEDIHAATLEFVDYWRGVPGARARKLDWGGTWRNSVRAWARKNRRKFVEKAA